MYSEPRKQILFNDNFVVIEHVMMIIKIIKTFHVLVMCNQNLINHQILLCTYYASHYNIIDTQKKNTDFNYFLLELTGKQIQGGAKVCVVYVENKTIINT